mmetsp:Transcript_33451/g.50602  ORF Transcript_33451/g.50602 Transcript_33451/m.50602 type:complete len:85 (+) Transcript_33451:189-443(+)
MPSFRSAGSQHGQQCLPVPLPTIYPLALPCLLGWLIGIVASVSSWGSLQRDFVDPGPWLFAALQNSWQKGGAEWRNLIVDVGSC